MSSQSESAGDPLVAFRLPEDKLDALDEVVEEDELDNRSAAIRSAIDRLLDSADGSEEDDREIRTDGGAPYMLPDDNPPSPSHWCETAGSRLYCSTLECPYCGDDDREELVTDGGRDRDPVDNPEDRRRRYIPTPENRKQLTDLLADVCHDAHDAGVPIEDIERSLADVESEVNALYHIEEVAEIIKTEGSR